MTTLKAVKAYAAMIGAKVEDDKIGDTHECRVEAPHGKIWACCGIHELIDNTNRPWRPDYADLINRMQHGIEDCLKGLNCEWCYPDEK